MSPLATPQDAVGLHKRILAEVNGCPGDGDELVFFCHRTVVPVSVKGFINRVDLTQVPEVYEQLKELCRFCQVTAPQLQMKKSELLALLDDCQSKIAPSPDRPAKDECIIDWQPSEESLLPLFIGPVSAGRILDSYQDDSLANLPPPMARPHNNPKTDGDNPHRVKEHSALTGFRENNTQENNTQENNTQENSAQEQWLGIPENLQYQGEGIDKEWQLARQAVKPGVHNRREPYNKAVMAGQLKILKNRLKIVRNKLASSPEPAAKTMGTVLKQVCQSVRARKGGYRLTFKSPALVEQLKQNPKQGEKLQQDLFAAVGILNPLDPTPEWAIEDNPLGLDPNLVFLEQNSAEEHNGIKKGNNVFSIYGKGCIREYRYGLDKHVRKSR